MYQAGTLSGNPLAMTAGIKTLEILDRPGTYEHLDKVTGKLIQGILDAGREAGHEMCGGHISGESCLLAKSLQHATRRPAPTHPSCTSTASDAVQSTYMVALEPLLVLCGLIVCLIPEAQAFRG